MLDFSCLSLSKSGRQKCGQVNLEKIVWLLFCQELFLHSNPSKSKMSAVKHGCGTLYSSLPSDSSQKYWSEDTVRTCVAVLRWNVIKWKFSDLRVGNGGRGPYTYPIFSPPGVLCALLLAGKHLACLISPFAPGVHSTCLPVTASQPQILSQFSITALIVKVEG